MKNKSSILLREKLLKIAYSTDASAYREIPQKIIIPKTSEEIQKVIIKAYKNSENIIIRGAGTSLAGQVVGNGKIIDISKHFKNIIELNIEQKYAWIEPGVVRDEFNKEIEEHKIFYGPETSTSNRCTIGGMIGNNSCGLHSLVYGSARDHLLAVKGYLSDGSHVEFGELDTEEYNKKCTLESLEGEIYRFFDKTLKNKDILNEIELQYPDKQVKRRNTGYALDLLADCEIYTNSKKKFNLCKLIAGSEGTLFYASEIKINLIDSPPQYNALICAHFNSLKQAIKANLICLEHYPTAVELMDRNIIKCTEGNLSQKNNRFFLKGDAAAILMIELVCNSETELNKKCDKLIAHLKQKNYGFHYPILRHSDITKAWELRKAGLGILSNIEGEAKTVPVIEDTAINPEKLESFIDDMELILKKHNKKCVYYAHIATGELHLRPLLNLHNSEDIELFRIIAKETALLVKKYKGSLSGEHGDGRLRGEFIPIMYGEKIYDIFKELKSVFDPNNIFNRGKIIDTPPMNSSLRYIANHKVKLPKTYFRYGEQSDFLQASEKCNGSGDCLKTQLMGGTMCPSYKASLDELNTPRARANIIREFITYSNKKDVLLSKEIKQILDLCLSCKACKSECPSTVDITKLKAEFLQHYYKKRPPSLRTILISRFPDINKFFSVFPKFFNSLAKNKYSSYAIKGLIGFAQERDIPLLATESLKKWFKKNNATIENPIKTICIFFDEFTNYNDVEIGKKAILLLNKLGYNIISLDHKQSGRTLLSKGFLKKAQKIANYNVNSLSPLIKEGIPLIGIEPSCILSFRDEYPDLVDLALEEKAKQLSLLSFTIDEFIVEEFKKGNIKKNDFTNKEKHILLHNHCHQKSIASNQSNIDMLQIPTNFFVSEIPSGCCGMAGSFGYEKEHYEFSKKVGELVLFPSIRNAGKDYIISAPGTSCRQQIKDNTKRLALHPIEIMYEGLRKV